METRNWKERIKATRDKSLTDRGIILPKSDKENEKLKKDSSDRGGIVFIPQEEKVVLDGN